MDSIEVNRVVTDWVLENVTGVSGRVNGAIVNRLTRAYCEANKPHKQDDIVSETAGDPVCEITAWLKESDVPQRIIKRYVDLYNS